MHHLVVYYERLLGVNRPWIVVAALLFALGLLGGFGLALQDPGQAGRMLEETLRALRGTIGPLGGGTWAGVWAVFLNNVRATTIAMATGVLVGLVPALVLLANGVLLGALLGLALSGATRLPLGLLPLALLPHGIIELPTLVLAGAWGLKVGVAWLSPHAAGRRGRVFVATLREALSIYAMVLVLLFAAATVEMLLTYALVRAATGGGS